MPWEPLQWVQKRAWSRGALEGQSRHRVQERPWESQTTTGHSTQIHSHSKNLSH